MKVCIALYAPLYVTVDTRTGKVLGVEVDDEGVEIGAGVNDFEDIEVNDLVTFDAVPDDVRGKAIAIASNADWPAWPDWHLLIVAR